MTVDNLERYKRFHLTRPCPKCGCGPTPSVFCARVGPSLTGWPLVYLDSHPYVPEGGHLHRCCLHCGYNRVELALDTPLMSRAARQATADAYEAEILGRRAAVMGGILIRGEALPSAAT